MPILVEKGEKKDSGGDDQHISERRGESASEDPEDRPNKNRNQDNDEQSLEEFGSFAGLIEREVLDVVSGQEIVSVLSLAVEEVVYEIPDDRSFAVIEHSLYGSFSGSSEIGLQSGSS